MIFISFANLFEYSVLKPIMIMKHLCIWASLIGCLLHIQLSSTVVAQTKLPAILSDNMCLQQMSEVKVWGWDTPGKNVTISPSWNKKGMSTKTNEAGKWMVKITTPGAGGPHSIKVRGSIDITLENVLIGELWVCSGQSNMDRKLGLQPGQKPIVNYWEASQQANQPDIRLFIVKRALSAEPQEDVEGEWVVCSPETVLEFSAVGYFFGKKLHDELSVPVGLIESAWGGTPVEGWTRKSAMNNDFLTDREATLLENFPVDSVSFANNKEAFERGFIKSPPSVPESFFAQNRKHHRIGALYNAMIHPLLNFTIRGAIWYQGESNRNFPKQYKKQFPNMIRNWRQDWGIGDFPFYFVQIAPYYYNEEYAIPPIWEAQYEALKLPQTGMASTQDIGQIYDIHPPEKEEVGRRLALIALNKTYAQTEVVYSGPVLKSARTEGKQVILEFDPMGGELFSAGKGIGGIPSFYLSGERRIFYSAEVRQEGNRLILTSGEVEDPVAVRYLWNDRANATIFNTYGLPAAGFRTDDWEDARYGE